MEHSPSPPLARAERVEVFRIATRSFVHWYGNEFADGMTDEVLAGKLQSALGVFGGSGGPDRFSVTQKGAGLKIWGAKNVINHVIEKPLFQGIQTIAMAREVYAIPDPKQAQMNLC